MKNLKTHKVILLTTEDISNIGIPLGDLQYDKDGFDPHIVQCLHLYIVSDDTKDGDWCIHNDIVKQAVGDVVPFANKHSKKIVATTDILSFTNEKHELGKVTDYLPQIPESFIPVYIKAYNDGKPITEVNLEMVEIFPETEKAVELYEDLNILPQIIKTRPDNTVIIRESKMYSRKEVEELIYKYRDDRYDKISKGIAIPMNFTEDWIQDNL